MEKGYCGVPKNNNSDTSPFAKRDTAIATDNYAVTPNIVVTKGRAYKVNNISWDNLFGWFIRIKDDKGILHWFYSCGFKQNDVKTHLAKA